MSLSRFLLASFLVSLVAAVPLPLRADDLDEGPPEAPAEEPVVPPKKAEVVVVGTRRNEPEKGATIRVLTREEIDKIPARTLPELLRELPGIDVRRRGVEGVQADIGIRGADFNGTLILVDGEPVNDPQTNHLSADLDVPLDAVERIEVLYGAGSSLYGSAAVGGVVNVVTRGADLGRAHAQLEARFAHGTDSLDAGSLRVAGKTSERLTLALDASRGESSGFRDDTELSTKTARVSARWDAPNGPVTLSLGYASRDYGAYAFYGDRFPNQQESTRTRTARLAGELTFGAITVVPSVSIRAHHDDFVLDRARPSFYENRHDADASAARVYARAPLFGGTVAFGVEAGREAIRSTNLGDHTRDHGAFFAELGRSFGTASVSAGFRADTYEGFGSRLSPRLALSLTPVSGLRLRASVGTAFRVPTFLDLYYKDPQTLGNVDLRAEKATNVEAGGSVDAGPLTFDGVFFYRHGVDLIDYVRNTPTDLFMARNVRQLDTYGVEASLDWDLARNPVKPFTRLALSAAYVFTDLASLSAAADGATEGRYVLDPLHVKWDLIVAATLPYDLQARSRLTYFARPSFADGVTLVDLRLSRSLLEGNILEAYMEGENLGNVRYQDRP
ncbi:MAG TPA: TonB-dependent receptor, partial [Thermoanaerobaculia bacterium]|nr:TonB-dependent receptor [Thermoanaerobaculia bacterium]